MAEVFPEGTEVVEVYKTRFGNRERRWKAVVEGGVYGGRIKIRRTHDDDGNLIECYAHPVYPGRLEVVRGN